MVKTKYMIEIQKDINEKMRAILIDWLVDVHLKFTLLPETLFLTINIIDRFLEKESIKKDILQLVGITALFISSKYEEIYPPDLKHFAFVTDNTYSKGRIIEMEGRILSSLNFNICFTSSYRFLERFSHLTILSEKEFFFCQYIIELCFLEYSMIDFKPSVVANSSIYLLNKIKKKKNPFPEILARNSKLEEKDLQDCVQNICTILQNVESSFLLAPKKKFSHQNFLKVSNLQLSDFESD